MYISYLLVFKCSNRLDPKIVMEYPEIQIKYLAQLYRVAAQYAESVFNLLPEKSFSFSDIEERSQGAEKMGKNAKFCPSAKICLTVVLPNVISYSNNLAP